MRNRAVPIIGVTGPDRGGEAAWLFTRLAVAIAGGRALRITPRHPRDINAIDALILGGGADVNPNLYGQELLHIVKFKPRANRVWWQSIVDPVVLPLTWLIRKSAAISNKTRVGPDLARDQMELRLLDRAVERRIPVLGVCRGMQLIDVYFGGSLHQSLKGFYVEDPEIRTMLPRKRVSIEEKSKLASIVGARLVEVNALHNQAIDRLGTRLRAAARDRNGLIQAIEHESLPMVIGVQWHPEYLPQLRRQRAIFSSLVRAARCARSE